MPNSRFGYSVKKNSFKGLNIDCIQYSNIIRITHYLYSYSGTILNPNIIRIHIRPNILHEYYSYSYSLILKKRILFVFVFGRNSDAEYYSYSFGQRNSIRSPLVNTITYFCDLCLHFSYIEFVLKTFSLVIIFCANTMR